MLPIPRLPPVGRVLKLAEKHMRAAPRSSEDVGRGTYTIRARLVLVRPCAAQQRFLAAFKKRERVTVAHGGTF